MSICFKNVSLTIGIVLAALLAGCGGDKGLSTPTGPSVDSNRAPQVSQSIPDETILVGDEVSWLMTLYFSDPGDTLTYDATSSNTHVATVSVERSGQLSQVTVLAMNPGTANVTVTARDANGLPQCSPPA